jgi:FkbM family methyltransferase
MAAYVDFSIGSYITKAKKHGLFGTLKIILNFFNNYIFRIQRFIKIQIEKVRNEESYIIKNVQGSDMLLNLNDTGISQELFFTGVHEPESTKQFKKELKPGMTIFELGANIGYYALIGAKIVGPKGKIIAFEPSPVNMRSFKANVALNNIEKIVDTYQMGIGDKTGKMLFNLVNKGNMSSFYNRNDGDGIKTLKSIEVDVISVDDFLLDKQIKIDYMRMDVEGYEYEIFQGMKKFLYTEYAPTAFFIEVHSELLNNNGHSCKEFVLMLNTFGYDVTSARWRGKKEQLVTSTKALLEHSLCEQGYWEAFFRKPQ